MNESIVKLRKCRVIPLHSGEVLTAIFHRWFTDPDNEACAVVEFGDGTVETPLASQIKFIDSWGAKQ